MEVEMRGPTPVLDYFTPDSTISFLPLPQLADPLEGVEGLDDMARSLIQANLDTNRHFYCKDLKSSPIFLKFSSDICSQNIHVEHCVNGLKNVWFHCPSMFQYFASSGITDHSLFTHDEKRHFTIPVPFFGSVKVHVPGFSSYLLSSLF